jgi:hypothetical protein
MIAWTTLRDELTALFCGLSGVSADASGDADGTFSFPSDTTQASLRWRIRGEDSLGSDELRTSINEDYEFAGDSSGKTGAVLYTLIGQRELFVEVRIECGRQDVTARPALEALRTRIGLPSSLRTLRELGLALVRIGRIIEAPGYNPDGRALSVYLVEITFATTSIEVDTPATTIETITSTETITT